MNHDQNPATYPLATELVQALRRSDAVLYVIARPVRGGPCDEITIDCGSRIPSHREAAAMLRSVAADWEETADANGEPPAVFEGAVKVATIDTKKEINGS